MAHFKIGTRPSKLALWQAHHVESLLKAKDHSVELVKITTKGDKILDRSLSQIGGKGLFLKEIEEALLEKKIDIAVHSLKDVPYELPKDLTLAAILKREDPTDALVTNTKQRLNDLPKGATIGTSSLRRSIQLKKIRSDLNIIPLRGNVDTRLNKLKSGDFDAIILASAGLIRLNLENEICERLPIVSAVAQGAIAIECRDDDQKTLNILKDFNHKETRECVTLERLFLEKVEGSCTTPLGAHVQKQDLEFEFNAFSAKPDGSDYQNFSFVSDFDNLKEWIEETFG